MRVVAGYLKGRVFAEPHGHHTHPMSEKVRGALFNTLGDIEDLTVLDAFSGSGALAFEAISRGAKSVLAIERDPMVHKVVAQSIKDLKLADQIHAVRAGAGGWSDNNSDEQFDIVILAPPYGDLQPNLLQKLTRHIKKDGILVLDYPGKQEAPVFDGLEEIRKKEYGDAQLIFYRTSINNKYK
jgi:16S rRNA (guanine966-N2)-methyltransferase